MTWLTRLTWAAAAMFALFLIVSAVPYRYSLLASGDYGYRATAQELAISLSGIALFLTALEVAAWLSFILVAGIIAWHKTTYWFPLLIAITLTFLGAMPPLVDGLVTASPAWQTFIPILRTLVYTGMLAMLCLFPDGRFVPGWSRWCLVAWLLFVLIFWRFVSAVFLEMSMIPDRPTLPNGFVLLAMAVLATFGLLFQFFRYRNYASAEQRQQSKFFLYGQVLLAVSSLINGLSLSLFPAIRVTAHGNFLYSLGMETVLMLAGIGFSLSVTFAILRYRLWDIDILINRSLVYGGLTATTVVVYGLLVGGVGSLLQRHGSTVAAFVATGVVAVMFQPLRIRLQTAVDRLMFGQRDDPVGMLSQLAQRLETVDSTESILPTLVETIGTALKLPYVVLSLPEEESGPSETPALYWKPAAAYGLKGEGELLEIPLLHQKREIGRLFLAPRGPRERFTREDEQLLAMIAQISATTVRAAQLSAELQQSRRQIITSREEERRRLRRDLHDGLGPVLASVALQADIARDMTSSDPEETKAILQSIMAQAQAAVADVRRLVYDLRPPALDEMGLVGALRQSALSLRHHVTVRFQASDLPPLPAALEVAAYRIAQEALNNVVHHARARHCTVRITADNGIWLVVEDDGIGIGSDASAGVGLLSLKERAAELGGHCVVRRREGGGTSVEAFLPFRMAERR